MRWFGDQRDVLWRDSAISFPSGRTGKGCFPVSFVVGGVVLQA